MNKLSKLAFIATAVGCIRFGTVGAGVAQAVNDNWVNGTGEWVDERYERNLLARCVLDAGHRQREVRWRTGRPGTAAAGRSGRSGYHEPEDHVSS